MEQHWSHPDPVPAAVAVGALLAPVVAALRDDHEGVRILLDGTCEEQRVVAAALRAAPAVVRVYLRLAPPPDGADRIVAGYTPPDLDEFGDGDIVTVGRECLEVARLGASLAPIADAVFVDSALDHGPWCALAGAVATCWWCASEGAALRGHDPIEETAAICRFLARVA